MQECLFRLRNSTIGGSVETAEYVFSMIFYRGPCSVGKKQLLTKNKKYLKRLVSYSTRRASVILTNLRFEVAKCVYYCISCMQMRFVRTAKLSTKKYDMRFLSCFTILNAIAKNRKLEFQTPNENVSKPSRLRIKVTCRFLKGRNQDTKTTTLAQTFHKN